MCGVALAFALAITPASYSDAAPAPAARAEAPHSVAGEPLYADIIRRAQKLEAEVAALRTPDRKASATAAPLPGFDRIKAEAAQLAELDMQGQPDSVALSPDGRYAAVAVENERDEDVNDGDLPQEPSGHLMIVDIKGLPGTWQTRKVDLAGLAGIAADDAEPEYVDINRRNIAAVTLQENNHLCKTA